MKYIDLHLHLDGALSVKNVRMLAEMQHIPLPERDDELKKAMTVSDRCRSLQDYLALFGLSISLLQTAPAVTAAMRCLLEELAQKQVIYAEIRCAPQLFTQKGMSQEEAVRALLDGMKGAPLDAGLILCAMRGENNTEANMETARLCGKYLGRGVCALDLAGAEAVYRTACYEELFQYARENRIPYTIHAGEADGPESVTAALDFGALRIGHGVRSTEDMRVVERLAREGVPLELCPKSNLDTRIYADISEYPIRILMNAGVRVTVNTDDPAVSDTDITLEWQRLRDTFALTEQEIKRILLDTVDASFANAAIKEKLRNIILNDMP